MKTPKLFICGAAAIAAVIAVASLPAVQAQVAQPLPPPTPAGHPTSYAKVDITEDFANLILKMLEKKKEDRPRDFHEILMQMRNMRILKGQPARQVGEG